MKIHCVCVCDFTSSGDGMHDDVSEGRIGIASNLEHSYDIEQNNTMLSATQFITVQAESCSVNDNIAYHSEESAE